MIYFFITSICVLIDQVCKSKAVKEMNNGTSRSILNNNIILKLNYNEGAFMGFLKQNKIVLLILNIICLLFLIGLSVTYLFIKGEYLIKLGVGFMTGGAISNIYDRLKRKKVVDYFAFKFKPNIVFNLADFFVFIGGFFLLISSLISKK